jgi:hypothetical protein
MMLAFCAKYGAQEQTDRGLKTLTHLHGPLPRLRLLPKGYGKDETFYPRAAAHALLGLACAAYGR